MGTYIKVTDKGGQVNKGHWWYVMKDKKNVDLYFAFSSFILIYILHFSFFFGSYNAPTEISCTSVSDYDLKWTLRPTTLSY